MQGATENMRHASRGLVRLLWHLRVPGHSGRFSVRFLDDDVVYSRFGVNILLDSLLLLVADAEWARGMVYGCMLYTLLRFDLLGRFALVHFHTHPQVAHAAHVHTRSPIRLLATTSRSVRRVHAITVTDITQ